MQMKKLSSGLLAGCVLFAAAAVSLPGALLFAQEKPVAATPGQPGKLSLEYAVMCEGVKDFKPLNPGVVFSITVGKISCFTAFDAVPSKVFIGHKWYFRDRLVAQMSRVLKPPRWATVSSIQLRASDRGPWRVEIVDSTGKILRVLRFSITD